MALKEADHDVRDGIFFFDPDDRIYADHFPGRPVVPGSLIVQAFILAGEKLGLCKEPSIMENFRFKRFIQPGEYAYRVEVTKKGLECRLYDGQSVVVTGALR